MLVEHPPSAAVYFHLPSKPFPYFSPTCLVVTFPMIINSYPNFQLPIAPSIVQSDLCSCTIQSVIEENMFELQPIHILQCTYTYSNLLRYGLHYVYISHYLYTHIAFCAHVTLSLSLPLSLYINLYTHIASHIYKYDGNIYIYIRITSTQT